LYAIVAELLEQLGIGTPDQRRRLDAFRHPPMRNTMGVDIGRLDVSLKLERH
jgi:L-asparaginase II